MKILLFGNLGFIASNLTKYLLERDYHVVGVDLELEEANRGRQYEFFKFPLQYSYAKGDICDFSFVRKVLEEAKPDVVAHFAAETHNDKSIKDPLLFSKTNVGGTANILEACRQLEIPMIQISTDETIHHEAPKWIQYVDGFKGRPGGGKWLFTRQTEDSARIVGNSPYSASKAGAELLCHAYINTYKHPIKIIRSCNQYGPFQHKSKFLPVVINKILKDEKIPIYGQGLEWRDWLFVEDFCRAFELILLNGKDGQVYHVAAQKEMQNIDTVKLILSLMGRDESLIDFVANRPGHDHGYFMSCQKLQQMGWCSRVSFEEGLQKTIDYYKSLC